MTETPASLGRKIESATDLQSVIKTMKALAASNVSHFQGSVQSLAAYYHNLQLALGTCLRAEGVPQLAPKPSKPTKPQSIGVIVFGSDQGLVGRFNEVLAEHVVQRLAELPIEPVVWAVGERVYARLEVAGMKLAGFHTVPTSVPAIAPLIGELLVNAAGHLDPSGRHELYLFHNKPTTGSAYTPSEQQLLPLDEEWGRALIARPWPTKSPAQVLGQNLTTLRALIREYLFISLFRACAESLASENASRLAAMQRADKHIDDLLETLASEQNSIRQSRIDEELFDVISGFEAIQEAGQPPHS